MKTNDSEVEELQQTPQYIPGPPQLPSLIKGQKLKSGPYITTVTDEMVAQRERENLELYKAWLLEQRRMNLLPQENADEYFGDFKNVAVRRSFIRKVFCLVTLQLIFTMNIIAIFMFVDVAQKFMMLHWYLWVIAMIIFTITYCTISCSWHARRTPPYNYICLFLMTIAMSYLSAFVSVLYSFEVILIAMGMAAIVTMIISFVATFSKFDLTMRPGLLLVFGLVAIVAILTLLIILIFTQVNVLRLVISIIGTLLLCMYLYFDVQTIMGGHRVQLAPNEVVFAATQIYVDIVLLYQYILMFMGFVRNI